MTTIAYRAGILAADRKAVTSNASVFSVTKAKKIGGWLCALSGDLMPQVAVHGMIETRLSDGGSMEGIWGQIGWKDEGYVAGYLISPEGVIYRVESAKDGAIAGAVVDAEFVACGTGRDFALAAMALGRTAFQAVELAMQFDPNTGSGVETVELAAPPSLLGAGGDCVSARTESAETSVQDVAGRLRQAEALQIIAKTLGVEPFAEHHARHNLDGAYEDMRRTGVADEVSLRTIDRVMAQLGNVELSLEAAGIVPPPTYCAACLTALVGDSCPSCGGLDEGGAEECDTFSTLQRATEYALNAKPASASQAADQQPAQSADEQHNPPTQPKAEGEDAYPPPAGYLRLASRACVCPHGWIDGNGALWCCGDPPPDGEQAALADPAEPTLEWTRSSLEPFGPWVVATFAGELSCLGIDGKPGEVGMFYRHQLPMAGPDLAPPVKWQETATPVIEAEPPPVLRSDVPTDAATFTDGKGQDFATFGGHTHRIISNPEPEPGPAFSADHEHDPDAVAEQVIQSLIDGARTEAAPEGEPVVATKTYMDGDQLVVREVTHSEMYKTGAEMEAEDEQPDEPEKRLSGFRALFGIKEPA